MPGPKPLPLDLSAHERRVLRGWLRKQTASQALVLRLRIVLACAEGRLNAQVADDLGVSRETVRKWRSRFVAGRLEGLVDRPRLGAPRKITCRRSNCSRRSRVKPARKFRASCSPRNAARSLSDSWICPSRSGSIWKKSAGWIVPALYASLRRRFRSNKESRVPCSCQIRISGLLAAYCSESTFRTSSMMASSTLSIRRARPRQLDELHE
ncbi:helix-turn-helix domain-containing protein [Streptomyces sp. NPDC088197]|uniref:helix-turn-helix domain-containing protein n=1 Tax=Streptomyces sp. NPDC088197 TaxID=3365840 RepID=UPI0038242D48